MQTYLLDSYREKVSIRITAEQKTQLERAALKARITPSEWTRRQFVKALRPDPDEHQIEATAMERLLLAKLCKQEELLRRLALHFSLNGQNGTEATPTNNLASLD